MAAQLGPIPPLAQSHTKKARHWLRGIPLILGRGQGRECQLPMGPGCFLLGAFPSSHPRVPLFIACCLPAPSAHRAPLALVRREGEGKDQASGQGQE